MDKKKYARTVGELIEVLSQYDGNDEIFVEHVRDGRISPVGVQMDSGWLTVYPPGSYELRNKGVKHE
jgi:hypothetical protein